jgi:hypothetical protein
MILYMAGMDEINESDANDLCKSCGLCCTGHLFIWTKLRSVELDSMEKLGVQVLRSDPQQRGFNQPCPLWDGQCTIYDSPHYPRFCHTYKCKLLKKLLDEAISLADALKTIRQAKEMIRDVEMLLPSSSNTNFRERLVAQLEGLKNTTPEFLQKVDALLAVYEKVFGVKDLIDKQDEE